MATSTMSALRVVSAQNDIQLVAGLLDRLDRLSRIQPNIIGFEFLLHHPGQIARHPGQKVGSGFDHFHGNAPGP